MRTRLRELRPQDMDAAQKLLSEQNKRDGTSYAVPLIFGPDGRRLDGVPLALAAEDVESGAVRQVHVWERTLEQMSFGIDPHATVMSMREQDAVWYLLRERGYRDLHLFLPAAVSSAMENCLRRRMDLIDTRMELRHFYRMLDPDENADLKAWYGDRERSRRG